MIKNDLVCFRLRGSPIKACQINRGLTYYLSFWGNCLEFACVGCGLSVTFNELGGELHCAGLDSKSEHGMDG